MNGENALVAEDIVGPVNLLLQSLFSQVDVSMQNKPINSSEAHYQYLSMLNTLLNFGTDAKSSQLIHSYGRVITLENLMTAMPKLEEIQVC